MSVPTIFGKLHFRVPHSTSIRRPKFRGKQRFQFTFVAVARHLKTNQQHQYFEKFLFCELILKMTSIYQSSVKFVPEISLVRDDDPRLSLDGLHHEGAHVGVGEGLVEGGNIVVGNALEPRN
jgi:hypothetical protein